MGKLLIKGKLYSPIKVGDPGDWYEGREHAECGDCGAKYGEQHLPGCDIERCPACGLQLISCDCGKVYDVEEKEKTADAEIEYLLQERLRQSELE